MSQYYKGKRKRNLYDPLSNKKFKLSRSKIDLFLNCRFCFYLDRRLGLGAPPSFPFNLNSAVDELLKNEFDQYREKQKPHPLLVKHKLQHIVPFQHHKINEWRDSLHKGLQYEVPQTNLLVTGGVDDIWINQNTQELYIVDYKATSKKSAVTLDADWQIAYKRQAEIYQFLLRKNGFEVNPTTYFVYCNGDSQRSEFCSTLHFDVTLIPYQGNDSWVSKTLHQAYDCLNSDTAPPSEENCDNCRYYNERKKIIDD